MQSLSNMPILNKPEIYSRELHLNLCVSSKSDGYTLSKYSQLNMCKARQKSLNVEGQANLYSIAACTVVVCKCAQSHYVNGLHSRPWHLEGKLSERVLLGHLTLSVILHILLLCFQHLTVWVAQSLGDRHFCSART